MWMASTISRVTALRGILETLTGDQQETFDENVTIEYSRTYTISLKSEWRENVDNWTVKLMIFHENDFVFTREICFTYLLTIRNIICISLCTQ